jgi:tRNA (cmo5U34)-methyltransferase
MTATTPCYRWNTSAAAEAYDHSAPAIHPHYKAVQNAIIDHLPFAQNESFIVVDLGGGSGRLLERMLERFAGAHAVLFDQSEPFLALAERRCDRWRIASRASSDACKMTGRPICRPRRLRL